MDSVYPYDYEPDRFTNNQEDPLVDNIKIELVEIKTETPDYCELNFENIIIEEAHGAVSSHDEQGREPVQKKLRKSQRSKRVEKYREDSDSEAERKSKRGRKSRPKHEDQNGEVEIKNKKKVKKKKQTKSEKAKVTLTEDIINRKKNRKRKKKGNKYVTFSEETSGEVKSTVYKTFLTGEGGALGNVQFRDIPLLRLSNTKGYSVRDEDLDKFRKEQDGKMLYSCEECSYTGLYRSAFMVHFVAHANLYFIMEALNKTVSSHYCYMCDVGCQSRPLLDQHLQKHREGEAEIVGLSEERPTTHGRKRGRKPKAVVKSEESDVDKKDIEVPLQMDSVKSSPRSVGEDMDNEQYFGDDYSNAFDDGGPLSDEEDNKKLSEIIAERIKVEEVEPKPEILEDKKVNIVVVKEEAAPPEAAASEQCYIKLESVEVRKELLQLKREDEKEYVKCEKCKFETEVGRLFKHKCKDTRRCDMCHKVLMNQRMFKYHRKLHFCDKCPFKSPNTDTVMDHRKNSVECWHKCTKCTFKTLNIESYYRHMRRKLCPDERKLNMERTAEVMKCDQCGYKTYYKEILAKHFKQHEAFRRGDLTLICDLCGKMCFNKSSMLCHYKSHYCSNCPFASVDRNEVMRHRKGNPDCLHKCKNCDFRALHIVTMRRHKKLGCNTNKDKSPVKHTRKVAKNFYCDICHYKTTTKTYLEDHIKRHADPKPFKCNLCDFKCSQKGNLIVHEKTHIDGKSYVCSLCNFQCSHYSKFRAHKKVHGLDENDSKPQDPESKDPRFLYCDRCEFRTKYPQYLKNHKLKHDNIRPYLCHLCGNSYFSLIDYHVHKNQAHTTKPKSLFKCSYCDYTYSKKATVKIHERKHTGNKPHCCEFCTYSTSYSGNLYAHRKKHLAPQPQTVNTV